MRTGKLLAGLLLASRSMASHLFNKRDECPSGGVHMSGFVLPGGSFDVCCPGTSVHADGTDFCCVGGGKHEKRVDRRVDICIGGAADCSSSTDATASCVTAVPATAGDFSERVASATRTMDSQETSSGSADPESSSNGAASITHGAALWPLWAAVGGGAAMHVALIA